VTSASTSHEGEKKLKKVPKLDLLIKETISHQHDVFLLASYFIEKEFLPDIRSHDYTKLDYIKEFRDNFHHSIVKGLPFREHEWWNFHVKMEPHHALDYTGRKKIHLGHFIHMIADWMCAGKTRSKDGKFNPPDMNSEKLKEKLLDAFINTIDWFDKNSRV
jgi:DNA-directed RNA polymerase subunit H (RpoH/RPB5)